MLLHGKILGGSQRHVGDKQTFHSRVFGRIDKRDDTIQSSSIGESVAEEVIVVIGHTHTTQDDLVSLGTHGHHSHYFVKGLVRVGKERNLLSADQGIVQVDTGNTGCNKLAGLLTAYGVHAGTTDLHLTAFNFGSAVNGVSISVEETSGQLLANLQRGALAEENHLSVSGNTGSTLKNLQRNLIAHNLYHLGQLAVDGCQFVITHSTRFQTAGGLGYLADGCIYFLKCCSHIFIYYI